MKPKPANLIRFMYVLYKTEDLTGGAAEDYTRRDLGIQRLFCL
jgi:hypothetical protein